MAYVYKLCRTVHCLFFVLVNAETKINTQIKVPEDFFDDQAMRGYVAPSCNLHGVPPVARSSGKAHRLYFSTTIMDIDPQTGFCSA